MGAAVPLEVERLVERVVREYRPERVILFGSYASGNPDEDSDVDLLIVKETSERPFERLKRVERIVRDRSRRVPIDVLVLTPGELDRRLAAGDAFLNEVMRRGVVLHAA